MKSIDFDTIADIYDLYANTVLDVHFFSVKRSARTALFLNSWRAPDGVVHVGLSCVADSGTPGCQ